MSQKFLLIGMKRKSLSLKKEPLMPKLWKFTLIVGDKMQDNIVIGDLEKCQTKFKKRFRNKLFNAHGQSFIMSIFTSITGLLFFDQF